MAYFAASPMIRLRWATKKGSPVTKSAPGALPVKARRKIIEIALAACVQHANWLPGKRCCRSGILQFHGRIWIVQVDEKRDCRGRHQLLKDADPLSREFTDKEGHAGCVTARLVKARHQAIRNRVKADRENHRNARSRGYCCLRADDPSSGYNQGHPAPNQFLGQRR